MGVTDEDINTGRPVGMLTYGPKDESGEVDLSLIDFMLSLTPEQRLQQVEEFAEWILRHHRAQGRDWLDFVNSSSDSPIITSNSSLSGE